MGVWQGVAMDSLKFHRRPPCYTFLHPAGRLPLKWPYVACPQVGRQAAVFYPLGHPTPYAYGSGKDDEAKVRDGLRGRDG
jgi:hypothetical protein